MADNSHGAPEAVSLSNLVAKATRQEDLPARVESSVQLGAWLGVAVVALYLVALWVLHTAIDDASVKPEFFFLGPAWELLRGASFLTGAPTFPVVAGVGVLIGGAWLGYQTGGFTLANRFEQLAMVGLLIAGGLALIPLLVILTVVSLHFVLWAVAFAFIIWFMFQMVVAMFNQ